MKKNRIWRRLLGLAIGACMTAGAWGAAFAADEITVCPEESPLMEKTPLGRAAS